MALAMPMTMRAQLEVLMMRPASSPETRLLAGAAVVAAAAAAPLLWAAVGTERGPPWEELISEVAQVGVPVRLQAALVEAVAQAGA